MNLAHKLLSLFALSAIAAGCGTVPAKASPDDPAGNFHQVSDGYYRGGRPDEAGVQRLAQMGVKTILDLENDPAAMATEQGWAEANGITFLTSPMDGMKTPNDQAVDEILALLKDKSKGPFYIHCMQGVDRTGLVVALHRVFNEGWTPADAYDEWKAMGFHTLLIALKDYYETKTHWED
jgi:protein tyrosine/serine phosphatase